MTKLDQEVLFIVAVWNITISTYHEAIYVSYKDFTI